MASSEQMEGGPRGSMRKKEIIKEPASSRVLKFMYMCIEISGLLIGQYNDRSCMSVLAFHLCTATIQMTGQTPAYTPYIYCD